MFTVGITGGIATGKSLATDFFSAKDIDIIDADKISRSLQEPGEVGYEAIVKNSVPPCYQKIKLLIDQSSEL